MKIEKWQHAASALQKKMVLFINLLGKGLTQEINRDGGSIWWAPGISIKLRFIGVWAKTTYLNSLFFIKAMWFYEIEIIFVRFSSLGLHLFPHCLHFTLCHARRPKLYSPVTKWVKACVRNATAKHAWIFWLDRTVIFKVKSSCIIITRNSIN